MPRTPRPQGRPPSSVSAPSPSPVKAVDEFYRVGTTDTCPLIAVVVTNANGFASRFSPIRPLMLDCIPRGVKAMDMFPDNFQRFQPIPKQSWPPTKEATPRSSTMNTATQLVTQFDGHPITTILYKDQPVWIAREVGAALGYEDEGKRLTTKITGDWSDEFIKDIDVLTIQNGELQELKHAIFAGTGQVPANLASSMVRSLTLLTQSGIYLACLKTHKEAGVRLRRLLADTILPQLHRTGHASLPGVPAGGISQSQDATLNEILATQKSILAALNAHSPNASVIPAPIVSTPPTSPASTPLLASTPVHFTREVAGRLGLKAYEVRTLAQHTGIGRRMGQDWLFTNEDIAALAEAVGESRRAQMPAPTWLAKGDFSDRAKWQGFVDDWAKEKGESRQNAFDLLPIADRYFRKEINGVTPRNRVTSLGIMLSRMDGMQFGNYNIVVRLDRHTKARWYALEKIE